MSSGNNTDDELRRREQALQQREQELRLRELEAELYQQEPPIQPTTKLEKPKRRQPKWLRKVVNISKFLVLMVGTLAFIWATYAIGIMLARVLIGAIMIAAIAWIGYKLFLEDKND